jgi:hypothetical protein
VQGHRVRKSARRGDHSVVRQHRCPAVRSATCSSTTWI